MGRIGQQAIVTLVVLAFQLSYAEMITKRHHDMIHMRWLF